MLHASDFYVMQPGRRLSDTGPMKSLAMSDLYQPEGEKLGIFQMVGTTATIAQIMQFMRDGAERDPRWWKFLAYPRPYWWRKLCSPIIRSAALIAYHVLNFKQATVWASAIEDLPYYDNRVIADPQSSNGMRFEYRYPEELKRRVASFRTRIARLLGPLRIFNLSSENNLNWGHVCGTCRFGDNPETSVLDRDNRAHDVANLYVVDASFFPSSGGINPTLTIAANALRVAEAIDRQLN